MADEDETPDDNEDAPAETEDEDGEDAPAGKKTEPKKKKSKTLLFVLLGVGVVVLVGGYVGIVAYLDWEKRQLAKNWGMQTMTPEEKKALEEQKKEKEIQAFVEEKRVNRTFFDECQLMSDQYTAPKGWHYTKLPLEILLGLPKYAGDGARNDRCAEFAGIVDRMESISQRQRHVFMCKGSIFKLPGGFYFEPDPKGRGVYHGHEALTKEKKFIPIKPGKSKIYAQWQFFNVGDGCSVVGYSKMRGQVFTMGSDTAEKTLK